jgi:hypothetical protein
MKRKERVTIVITMVVAGFYTYVILYFGGWLSP